MADVNALLGTGNKPETTAELVAARQTPNSLLTGGLAGILSASVLGGPVGALIGLAAGISTQRAKSHAIERTAADLAAGDKFSNRIYEQIKNSADYTKQYGTEQDLAQLGDIAQSVVRLQELTQHHDPAIRNTALAQLMAQDGRMDAWRSDIEDRTRVVADRDFALRDKIRGELNSAVTVENDALEDMNIRGGRILETLNRLPDGDPFVQSMFREYINSTLKEAESEGISASLGGFGINLGTAKASHKQIYEVVTGVMQSEGDVRRSRIAQYQQQARQDGFEVNVTDGQVSVFDTNTALQDFDTTLPKVKLPPQERTPTPAPKGNAGLPSAFSILSDQKGLGDKAFNMGIDVGQVVRDYGEEGAQAVLDFVSKARSAAKTRRSTNE